MKTILSTMLETPYRRSVLVEPTALTLKMHANLFSLLAPLANSTETVRSTLSPLDLLSQLFRVSYGVQTSVDPLLD